MIEINTPISEDTIRHLAVGDTISISGYIYAGRDAVLPKVVTLFEEGRLNEVGISLQGSVIFHTAVSLAGVGPTSSNKVEIEDSIPALSKAGVKIHLGKGALKQSTIEKLLIFNSAYAVIPPVTALLTNRIESKQIIAFPEEGIEAFHYLFVCNFPAVIAAVHGKTLY